MTNPAIDPVDIDLASPLIPGAVLHLANDQPLLVDLYGMPSASDPILVCTNVRSMTGKRPVWADHSASVFYFPWLHVRFLEIPPGAEARAGTARRAAEPISGPPAVIEALAPAMPAYEPEPDGDLEIDEDFLRRVREA